MTPDPALQNLLRERIARPPSPQIRALAEAAAARHGEAVAAVLHYGSCLRSGRADEGIADLYLLVDGYRAALGSPLQALLNRALPPNVFYLEIPFEGRTLRAKYAVISRDQFRKGTADWFHSYLWGRFAQPAGLLLARDAAAADEVAAGLAAAARTFLARALPAMEGAFSPRDLWARGLALSYGAELRPEPAEGAVRLFDADPGHFEAVTRLALAEGRLPAVVLEGEGTPRLRSTATPAARRAGRLGWRVRQAQGKGLSVLRLLKASLTFRGGVDYLLWKIERHSGMRVEVSPRLRRIPPVAVVATFWKLYRRGAFR